jgi:hypothetical protein
VKTLVPAVALSLAFLVPLAAADSTPVGPLPKGPVASVVTTRGALVAVALPRQSAASGLVWRLARRVDPAVLAQVSEADVGSSVVVVFRARGRGNVRIAFALTKGDTGSKALRAILTDVRVT